MKKIILAVDRAGSVRTIDEDGRLRVEKTRISKACINSYRGSEIPNYRELGLDAEKTYRLLRHPDELEKGAASFNNLPVLSDHVHVTAERPHKELVIGSTGTEASFEAPYLSNSMSINDQDAIDKIHSGEQREISCAYRYDPDMTRGTFEGQSYDGVMRNIRGNHVAIVPKGRAGSDVLVADSEEGMKMDINDLVAGFRTLCPDIGGDILRAELSDLAAKLNRKEAEGGEAAVENPEKITGDEKLDKSKTDALCADMPQAYQAMAETMRAEGKTEEQILKCLQMCASADTASDDEENAENPERDNPETPENPVEQEPRNAEDEKDDDEDADDDGEEEKPQGAADSLRASVMRALRAQNRAREAVKPLVGNVVAMDSASAKEIYGYALKKIGKKVDGVNCKGLRQMALMAADFLKPRATKVAMDCAPSLSGRTQLLADFGVKTQ